MLGQFIRRERDQRIHGAFALEACANVRIGRSAIGGSGGQSGAGPRTRIITKPISDGDLRCGRFATERGQVVSVTVRFEALSSGRYYPLVRYDSGHGRAHPDLLDWRGEVVAKDWLDPDSGSALTFADEDVRVNRQAYRVAFLRRMQ